MDEPIKKKIDLEDEVTPNNLADIRRYIRQTLNIVQYYRENAPTREEE